MNTDIQCSTLGDGIRLVVRCTPPFNGFQLDLAQMLLWGGAGIACILIGVAIIIWAMASYRAAAPNYLPCETCDEEAVK